MTLVALTCPHCGGRLEMTVRAELFKCAYCQFLTVLRWSDDEARAPELARLPGRQVWTANLLRPGDALNWQGGSLHLTDRELVFAPHALNVGPTERAVLPLRAIVDVALVTGLISDELTLLDRDGRRWGVRVSEGAAVRDAIRGAADAEPQPPSA